MKSERLTGQVGYYPQRHKQRHEVEDVIRVEQRLELAEWREQHDTTRSLMRHRTPSGPTAILTTNS